jgi:hypothetical protein
MSREVLKSRGTLKIGFSNGNYGGKKVRNKLPATILCTGSTAAYGDHEGLSARDDDLNVVNPFIIPICVLFLPNFVRTNPLQCQETEVFARSSSSEAVPLLSVKPVSSIMPGPRQHGRSGKKGLK